VFLLVSFHYFLNGHWAWTYAVLFCLVVRVSFEILEGDKNAVLMRFGVKKSKLKFDQNGYVVYDLYGSTSGSKKYFFRLIHQRKDN